MLSCKDEVLRLTKKFVSVQSVVNTEGEVEIAKYLYDEIANLPYFQAHPEHVLLDPVPNDRLKRKNVLAFVKGTKAHSNKTILVMGHMDTVGIEDFSHLKEFACDPDALMNALQNEPLPLSVKKHLESGEWLFGRGVLDMKSGVASNLFLLKYYSEHRDELAGNLVFIAECDEEDNSRGIQAAVSRLKQWKQEHDFDYVAAINADFVSPRYEGDVHRYVYKGTIGKLLPTFYIVGAETHVGSCFEGLDPNLLVSELTRQIDYNPDLCDTALGETTPPPVSLKQTDLKSAYTVQTALSAYVYYNFFTHSWSPKEVLQKLKEQAKIAFDRTLSLLDERYKAYCAKSGEPYQPLPWQVRVITYEELYESLVAQYGDRFTEHMDQFLDALAKDESLDSRSFAAKVVEEAWRFKKDQHPVIIVYYSSLHFPRVECSGQSEKEIKLMKALESAVEQVQPYYPYPIVTRNFFPYISDMSFISVSDTEENLLAEAKNNPSVGKILNVNYEEIRSLNVPVINIGPYGVDAHKKYERMELSYSFEIVPNLTNAVIQKLLLNE